MKKNFKKGFTLIELVVAIAILSSLFSIVMLTLNLPEYKKKARDSRRLADITNLNIAIESYKLKKGVYPDNSDVTRISTTPVDPNTDIHSALGGWIAEDMSDYLEKMYTDPINDSTYNYRYRHNSTDYELDVAMEFYTQKNTQDNGNNNNRFETGTDLTILN